MNSKIKIAVVGGTGKSGKYLVRQLIQQGFPFKILVRNPDHFHINHPLAEIIAGDITNYDSIDTLVKGCQAVISTLGLGIPASQPTIFSQSTRHIIQAMTEHRIRRYIVTTGLNVDTPWDHKAPATQQATNWMKKTFPSSTTDKQTEFDLLSKSRIDWTLVRLPLIEETDKRGVITVSLEDCPGDKISATDLANFLIAQLFNDEFTGKAPFVASRPAP